MKKRNWGQTGLFFCSAALTAAAICCVAVRMPQLSAPASALAAAGFTLPGGAAEAFRSGFSEAPGPEGAENAESTGTSAEEGEPPASLPSEAEFAVPATPESKPGTVETTVQGTIKEMSISNSGVNYESIWVKNSNKNHTIDIAAELSKQPAVKIKKDGTPQVLIYHTHTTESFDGVNRTQDNSKNVVAVGEEIVKQLEAAGIGVVHDKTCHDYPSYNGSYDRSGETMLRNLKKYPSIQVTLDIHRDAMGAQDGTRIKPTAMINGRKAAQVMIISGCDDDGDWGFPDWEYNLRLAVRLQKSVSEAYPGLIRPLNFCDRKYNEHITKGSLLVEFGTEVNTLDEVKYSGELFGQALVTALEKLQDAG